MKRWSVVAVVALLAGLLAVEVVHAVHRFQAISDRAAEDAIADLRGEVSRQAARLEDDLALGAAHARYLASLDSVRALLANPRSLGEAHDAALERAGRDAAAVLRHFPSFGGVVVLDSQGNERLRVERMGGGVAIVPSLLLREGAEAERTSAPAELAPGGVWISPLVLDARRVDVAEEDRLVLRYAAPVEGAAQGIVVLSLYAAPLLKALARLEPIPGVRMRLLDRAGNELPLGHLSGTAGAPARKPTFSEEHPEAFEALVRRGESSARADGGAFVASPTGPRPDGKDPAWLLVADAPARALERGARSLRSEVLEAGAILLATILAIGFVGLALVRMAAARERLEAQREAEQKLLESERLAALGRLTAGVAHEINNPLAGIGNYLALLERESADPERRREYLELVRHGFARIRAIARDLLSFANPPKPEREALALGAILDRVERVTKLDRGFRDIRWTRELPKDLPLIWGDPFAVEQVFLNLALNSRDALARVPTEAGAPPRGEIRVTARRDPAGPERVEIRFEDSGPGFPPDLLPRILEPFFTTRKGGTGLGLSVSAAIVRAHRGTIRAENRAEGGARFLLTFPAGDRESDAAPRNP